MCRQGSAGWQSAVSRIGNPQAALQELAPADYQSATQQVANLRYGFHIGYLCLRFNN